MNFIPFTTLIEREIYRFVRLSSQTVVPPLITTIMFILIFGYSLGSRITEIHGVPYIVFILPGLMMMGIINNAYANSSTSLFMARLERSIENLLVSPLSKMQIVSAYMIGGVLRGLVVGLTIFICTYLISLVSPLDFPIKHWGYVALGFFVPSCLFSGLGIISGLNAESWDKIALFTNFIITPFVYLGGVFYSVQMLPPFWQKISLANPIFYCVDLIRYGFLGISDVPIWISVSVVITFSIVIYVFCIYLFCKGYKIIK